MEERLTELEIRLALQDDLLDELNKLVAQQQRQIDQLVAAVRLLQENQAPAEAAAPRSLFDEIPPHY
ncbi:MULTISPECIES: SlyX family protein [Chitinibacter]|uniref:SlyX family protein n=1 Tax=Chitinibacter TaxID=230666 RepID=UPI000400A174|nr:MULTISPECIES: SlyX family protein [Chitinibacter]